MNKKISMILLLGIVGTLALVTGIKFLPLKKHLHPCQPTTQSPSALPMAQKEIQEIKNLEELSAALDGKRPMVLKFYANWCGACTYVKKYYPDLAQEVPEVDFYHIDIENQELMHHVEEKQLSKEGIEYLPTFIMIHPGKVHEQTTGAKKKEDMVTQEQS